MRVSLHTALSLFASSEVISPTGKFTDSAGLERETFNIRKTLESDDFHFVVIGDWGGRPAPFYTSPLQVSGAVALMKYAKINKPEYVVSIGDHFYFNGIESVQDRRWERTFEEVYDSEEMMVPWYPAMGNHDWDKLPEDTEGDRLGNGWAQIEYSAHGTGRWTHPDVFFTTEYTTADGAVVKTIIIDTTVLTGVYSGGPPLPDRDDPRCSNFYNMECPLKRLNPLFPEISHWAFEWIENELANSDNADYLFVTGHYMILDTGGVYDFELFRRLDPLFEKYNVNAFFQGHKHTHEHAIRSPNLVPEGAPEAEGTVHYVTTGAGALLDVEAVIFEILQGGPSPRSGCHERWENTGSDNGQAICQYYWSTRHMNSGFTSVHVTKERARVSFVTAEVDNPVDDFIVGHEFDILPRK